MDQQLLNATNAFIATMRRMWLSTGGEGECPIQPLESYPMKQRVALMLSLKAAISASKEIR